MVSERARATTAFEAMEVLDKANELEDVIHLEVGEPDFEPPAPAVEAAVDALRGGGLGYTAAKGKPELRDRIATYYDRRYGVDIDTERIVVTPGSSPALLLSYLAVIDPGQEAILTDPHYACYPNFVRQAGGELKYVTLDPSTGFRPDLDAFQRAISPNTQTVMVNSPSNPTGAVLSDAELAELTTMVERADAVMVADEAYHGLDYDQRAPSVLEHTQDAFVVDTFSKRFGMTGWRLGWLVVPPAYTDTVNRLAQNLIICASEFVQDAGIAALDAAPEFVPEIRDTYRERRDYVLDRIHDLGISLDYIPGGAYYVLLDVSHLGDAFSVADTLLEEARVALTPGRDFGPTAAPYLRLSYARSLEELATGLDRIERTLPTMAEQR
ncbi:MAG: pyridoxal phosphate-dependent aminotransferase [Halobacteriales archaeon]|nr:pyridoxal phosphate-dependent aminotransferase [Halobacteriales archaeon]